MASLISSLLDNMTKILNLIHIWRFNFISYYLILHKRVALLDNFGIPESGISLGHKINTNGRLTNILVTKSAMINRLLKTTHMKLLFMSTKQIVAYVI